MKKLFVLFVIFITVFFAGCSGNFEFEENSNLEDGVGGSGDLDVYVETEDQELNIEGQYEIKDVDYDEEKLFLAVGEGISEFELNGEKYVLVIESILPNGLYKVELNGVGLSIVEPYEKNKFNELYLFVLETVTSERESVKNYAEILITNYDYDVAIEDISNCFDTDSGNEQYSASATYGLSSDLSEILVEDDYCADAAYLVEYGCDTDGEERRVISSEKIKCEYGCQNSECLSIIDAGCDREELDSDKITVVEGETIELETLNFEILEVSEGLVLVSVNGNKKFVEMCHEEEFDEITILVHDTVASVRENVKGYVELSYDYEPIVEEEPVNNSDEVIVNETIEYDNTPKTISLGDFESTTISFNGVDYEIEILSIGELKSTILVNGVSQVVNHYSGEKVNGVYVYSNDVVLSARESVKSYIELIVSLEQIEGNFYCIDTGLEVVGLIGDLVNSVNDYCIDDNTLLDYSCAYDEMSIEDSTITCEFGCSGNSCNACTVPVGEELSNKVSIGEAGTEVVILGNHTYTFTIDSVSDSKVLLTYNFGSTKSYEVCDFFEYGDVRFQINDLVTSSRPGVAGYVEIGYELIQ